MQTTESQMDMETWKAEFDQLGFVVIRGFLEGDALAELRHELARYVREVGPRLSDRDAFYDDPARPETLRQLHRMEQDAFFAEYLRNPLWNRTARQLLGEPVRTPDGAEWFNKPPGSHSPTPPHQDNHYFCLTPPQVLTIWLALDDVDEENGCLRYVSRSHLHGMRPHARTQTLGFSQGIADFGEADLTAEIAVRAAPGDALIHHGNTIHRAEANRSTSRHRRSFAMVFRGESCTRDEAALARYQDSLRTQQAELIGGA
ncbi:MAG: phytanoyl-CoA dioxygenase family protein [Planctomycetaceae bacterium]|nr:MAG: phytanoyl-CoA dioxygenase family protein [Planctomycetaceae bacterium]